MYMLKHPVWVCAYAYVCVYILMLGKHILANFETV